MPNFRKGIGRMIHGQNVKHSMTMDGVMEVKSQDRMYHGQLMEYPMAIVFTTIGEKLTKECVGE